MSIQNVQIKFFKLWFEARFVQKKIENIDYGANNDTFVTNLEFESKYLNTLTQEPKLNHLVKNT